MSSASCKSRFFKDLSTDLKSLDVQWNELTCLNEVSQNTQLVHLFAFHNAIKTLDGVFRLCQLNTLDLSSNKLIVIPTDLFVFCPSIKELDLSRNQVKELPSLGSASNLVSLNAAFNELTVIPADFNQSLSLEMADLSFNQLSSHQPNCFQDLVRLTRLFLQHNALQSLPDLDDLLSLEILDLRGNDIVQLPWFGKIPHLKHLYIDEFK